MIAVYRLGSVIPGPGVSYVAIKSCLEQVQDNSLYSLVNLFTGGALLQLSVFALGIMPYITRASSCSCWSSSSRASSSSRRRASPVRPSSPSTPAT